eukprot:scaffold49874_cov65-Phaeocystis_antarctica.AAC.2
MRNTEELDELPPTRGENAPANTVGSRNCSFTGGIDAAFGVPSAHAKTKCKAWAKEVRSCAGGPSVPVTQEIKKARASAGGAAAQRLSVWADLEGHYAVHVAKVDSVVGELGLARGVDERCERGGVVGGRGLPITRVDLAAVLEPALVELVHVGVMEEERGVVGACDVRHRAADPDVDHVVHSAIAAADGFALIVRSAPALQHLPKRDGAKRVLVKWPGVVCGDLLRSLDVVRRGQRRAKIEARAMSRELPDDAVWLRACRSVIDRSYPARGYADVPATVGVRKGPVRNALAEA